MTRWGQLDSIAPIEFIGGSFGQIFYSGVWSNRCCVPGERVERWLFAGSNRSVGFAARLLCLDDHRFWRGLSDRDGGVGHYPVYSARHCLSRLLPLATPPPTGLSSNFWHRSKIAKNLFQSRLAVGSSSAPLNATNIGLTVPLRALQYKDAFGIISFSESAIAR